MGRIVGRNELEQLFRDTAAEHPDSVSPRASDGSCLYRSVVGAPCPVAYVLTQKLGFDYDPSWEGIEPHALLQKLGFDDEAAQVVLKWQDDPEKPPVRWGALLE